MVTLDDNKVYCGYIDWIPGDPSSRDAYLEILPVFSGYRNDERRIYLPTSYTLLLNQLDQKDWGQFKKVVPVARITSAGEFDPKYFEAFSKNQTQSRVPDSPPSAPATPVNTHSDSHAAQPVNAPTKPSDSATRSPPASNPA